MKPATGFVLYFERGHVFARVGLEIKEDGGLEERVDSVAGCPIDDRRRKHFFNILFFAEYPALSNVHRLRSTVHNKIRPIP
jgi:hypothetical protein